MKEKSSIFSFFGDKKKRGRFLSFAIVIVAYIIIEILLKTGNLKSLFTSLLVPITCYVVASIGLNLNVGVSGELNLGQAGFMSVGAFCGVCVSGILAGSITAGIPRLIIAIICGAVLAGVFAEVEKRVEHGAVKAGVFARALHFDEVLSVLHHDVHVDVGLAFVIATRQTASFIAFAPVIHQSTFSSERMLWAVKKSVQDAGRSPAR